MTIELEYVAEKRVAVVMYGGVSLAIYMGGVAQELLNVVRATSPAPRDPKRPDAPLRPGLENLSPIEAVYRKAATVDGTKLTSVTIDVIAGTSAGGINGIFLAKALAHDRPMKPILDLWIEEGDLAKLLNDRGSLHGTSLTRQDPPVALLNGERMYLKLVEAFDQMDDARDGHAPQFDAGDVDLFVTTTDIPGEVVRLPVDNNAAAQERMHKQRFHFAGGTHDGELAREQNPLLAFAARCTSSFPLAFEPFTWNDAARLAGKRAEGLNWTDRLLFVGDKYDERPFADGGVLDNKPFSYAIDELSKRQSHLTVDRMLVYVEPDPEKFDRARAATEKPSAFETVLFALTIPAEQTIRKDLETVIERNERIEKLKAVEDDVSEELRRQNHPPRLASQLWLNADMPLLVHLYGLQYPAYHRIKVDAVVASLSEMICSNASIGRPELVQVIRELLVAWLHRKYPTLKDELQLLLDVDLDYRLRKLSFVLRLLNEPELAKDPNAVTLRRELQLRYEQIATLRSRVEHDVGEYVAGLRGPHGLLSDENLLPIARAEKRPERAALIEKMLAGTELGDRLAEYLAEKDRRNELAIISNEATQVVAASKLTGIVKAYEAFESYDMVIYPITRRADVDEAVPVKIVRVSPLESTLHRDAALAGKQLGHFGAFLDEGFRHNDITWGRLDAASVILRQLAPDEATATRLIHEAHEAIVVEQLKANLENRVMTGSLPPRVRETALEQIGHSDRLLSAFSEGKVYDLDIDGVHQLGSAGRAGVILEQITRSWALRHKLPLPKFIAYGVLGLATLAQVAIPRSLPNAIGKYWGQILFVAFLVLGLVGLAGHQGEIARAGFEAAAIVVLLGTTVLAIRAAAGERRARIFFKIAQLAVTVALIRFAVWALSHTPENLRGELRMDAWWHPLDTFAVHAAILTMAVPLAVLFVRDAVEWLVAGARKLRLF